MINVLECSTKGDKRFSAFGAYVEVFGKRDSIENHYQTCKRFGKNGDIVPKSWREAKGKQPTAIEINGYRYPVEDLSAFYKLLWVKYLDQHPALVQYAKQFDDFHDIFKGHSTNCQADVIRTYIKLGRIVLMEDTKNFRERMYRNTKM